jgi:hypothetical protein
VNRIIRFYVIGHVRRGALMRIDASEFEKSIEEINKRKTDGTGTPQSRKSCDLFMGGHVCA